MRPNFDARTLGSIVLGLVVDSQQMLCTMEIYIIVGQLVVSPRSMPVTQLFGAMRLKLRLLGVIKDR